MKRRAILAMLGGSAVAPPCTASGQQALAAGDRGEVTPQERVAMAEVAKAFMERYAVPGLSVAVGHSGSIAYADAFGFFDHGSRKPLTPAHLFRIASVSKTITSVAIFSLVEQGRLRLDDRVFGRGAILAGHHARPPRGQHVDEITISHLLTHTCGGWSNASDDPMFGNPGMDHAELIEWTLRNRPLAHAPGTHYAYSNFGYCVLGRVIEEVTHQPYAAFVADAVLRRCGIDDMALAGNGLADRRRDEVVYHGQAREDPYGMNVTRMDSHGGWIARPVDIVKFAMCVSGFSPPRNLLRPETLRAMTTPSPANAAYAKGWAVNKAGNWWHTGSLPGTAMDRDLDDLAWDMVRKARAWRM